MADLETRRSVSLNRSDVEWFEASYGEGQLSWVLSLLLEEFRKHHTVSPSDLAAIGAKALKQDIEEGLR